MRFTFPPPLWPDSNVLTFDLPPIRFRFGALRPGRVALQNQKAFFFYARGGDQRISSRIKLLKEKRKLAFSSLPISLEGIGGEALRMPYRDGEAAGK